MAVTCVYTRSVSRAASKFQIPVSDLQPAACCSRQPFIIYMRDALSKKRSAMSDTSIDVPTSPHLAFPPSSSNSSLFSPSAFAPNGGVDDYPLPASHSQLYPPAVKAAAAGELAYGTAPVLKVLKERFGVLASLLVLQSLSSVILQRYEQLLEHHVEITLFLTMVYWANSGGVCVFSTLARLARLLIDAAFIIS